MRKKKTKVFVVLLDEYYLSGVCGRTHKIYVCGVHKTKPTKERMEDYSRDWGACIEDFDIIENIDLEE